MPFGEALQQMVLYTRFMKDILTKKGNYIDNENIMVGGNYSVVIQRKLPEKFKDLGSVIVPCTIGKALIDLGASINLMPLSMCRRIGNLKIDPTKMALQSADRLITRPYGVMEDVLVKIRHFTFPVDFVIIDIEEDAEITLILGRPFILSVNYVVDMGNDNLEMSIDNQNITFSIFEAIKCLGEDRMCFKVEEVDKEDVDILQTTSLDKALINVVNCLPSEEEKDIRSCLEELDREGHIHAEGTNCKELRSRNPSERTKLVVPDASPPSQVAHHQQESTSSAPDTHSQMLRSLYQGQQIII